MVWCRLLVLAVVGVLVAESRITYENRTTRLVQFNEAFFDVEYLNSTKILAAISGELREYEEASGYQNKSTIYDQTSDLIASMLKLDNEYIISRWSMNCITWIAGKTFTDIGNCSKETYGNKSGSFDECQFYAPWGLFKKSADKIIVADEFNNALRQIDLKTRQVSTLHTFSTDLRPAFYLEAGGTEYVGGHGLQYKSASSGGWKDLAPFKTPTENYYLTDITVLRPGVLAAADVINQKIWIIELGSDERTEAYELCRTDSTDCNFTQVNSLTLKDEINLLVGGMGVVEQVRLEGLPEKFMKKNLCHGVSNSSIQTITYKGRSMKVWCDLQTDNGPWITFLNRYDGSLDFNKPMADYEIGFGNHSAEHWLGLENLYTLTSDHTAEMRINLQSFKRIMVSGTTRSWAQYKKFWIGDKSTQYTLQEIDEVSGDAGDMETKGRLKSGGPHKGMKFSTYDMDKDGTQSNCAGDYGGGWWFNACYTACLTCGPYKNTEKKGYPFSIVYAPATKGMYTLKAASMMIKLPAEHEYRVL